MSALQPGIIERIGNGIWACSGADINLATPLAGTIFTISGISFFFVAPRRVATFRGRRRINRSLNNRLRGLYLNLDRHFGRHFLWQRGYGQTRTWHGCDWHHSSNFRSFYESNSGKLLHKRNEEIVNQFGVYWILSKCQRSGLMNRPVTSRSHDGASRQTVAALFKSSRNRAQDVAFAVIRGDSL